MRLGITVTPPPATQSTPVSWIPGGTFLDVFASGYSEYYRNKAEIERAKAEAARARARVVSANVAARSIAVDTSARAGKQKLLMIGAGVLIAGAIAFAVFGKKSKR